MAKCQYENCNKHLRSGWKYCWLHKTLGPHKNTQAYKDAKHELKTIYVLKLLLIISIGLPLTLMHPIFGLILLGAFSYVTYQYSKAKEELKAQLSAGQESQ